MLGGHPRSGNSVNRCDARAEPDRAPAFQRRQAGRAELGGTSWLVPDLHGVGPIRDDRYTRDCGCHVVIRTPDQRLRVFVSSTLGELSDERRAVAHAISALRLTPVMFELGARPHPPRELYRAYLAQSDIFIGLYWQRYGWVGPGMEISGLEDELELARALPRLLYVKAPAPDREPRLADLLTRIKEEAAVSYRSFRTSGELGRLVRDDLATLLSEQFAAARPGAVAAVPPSSAPPRGRAPRPLPVGTTSLGAGPTGGGPSPAR
jgi:hypothetical protein